MIIYLFTTRWNSSKMGFRKNIPEQGYILYRLYFILLIDHITSIQSPIVIEQI